MAKRNSLKSVIQYLRYFEKHAGMYNRFFSESGSHFNYVIIKTPYQLDFDIRVILTLTAKPKLRLYLENPWDLLELLESFCRLYSITQFSIDRPYYIFTNQEKQSELLLPLLQRIKVQYHNGDTSIRK